MANDPFLIVRKPTTPLGWTVSSAVVTFILGVAVASWQVIKNDIHALGESQHEIKTSIAVVQTGMDAVKEDVALLKQAAYKGKPMQTASAPPEDPQ